MDDYTVEFYKLVARVDLMEAEVQLVLYYIGGMLQQFQDSLIFFIFLFFLSNQCM
jgi:hypothetical protein